MYTQCPECHIAFRVTASVLQQADGRVRCGNCNHAFNAIHYLSEDMPSAPDPDDVLTEGVSRDDLAETSRRLLRTLDELAGPGGVRIEDTGVEWRVLDEAAMDDDLEDQPPTDALRYDDNSPLPEDLDDGDDSAWSTPAPRRRDEEYAASPVTFKDPQGDIALSDPEDWTDILEEVTDSAIDSLEVEEQIVAIHSELSAIEDDLTDEVPVLDEEGPDDNRFGADVTDVDFVLEADDDLPGDEAEPVVAENEDTGIPDVAAETVEPGEEPGAALDDELVVKTFGDGDEEWLETVTFDGSTSQSAEAADDDRAEDEIDAGGIEVTEEADDEDAIEAVAESADGAEPERPSVAAQDFTATFAALENPEDLFNESSGEVETIIMEGDFIRTEIERERLAAENAARSQLDDPERLMDTYAMRRRKSGGRRSYDPPSPRMIAAIAGLTLLLVAQVGHNARESLATFGFFNQTIAPLYRLVGSPVTPEWDIRGWQFETTNGSVDEGETTLTIVSRIGNRSLEPLPYPLIHLSLTNRYEDVMGSRVLEPGEYLSAELDPSRPVAPGEDFTAVLKVEEPSPDATGFKLNVCYRVRVGTVRCAIEDFKN